MPSQTFPVCSNGHAPTNMRIVELHRAIDEPQTERWRCPVCSAEFGCLNQFGRDIPEALRP